MKAYGPAAALLLALLATAAPARAGVVGDAFAGYSVLTGGDSGTLHGWQATLGSGGSGRVGLVVDVSGHRGSEADTGDDLDTLALMAGPRIRFGGGRLRPFAYLIGGVVRSKAGVTVYDVDIKEASTDFGGAGGAGFEFGFGARWALRVAGDYRVVKAEGGTASDPRLSAGVAYRFGAR